MFQLDDNFLKELGLDQLPAEQKQAFLDHIYSQLELRVGTRLSEGLSDAQLAEFESFVDRDQEKVHAWINAYAPAYVTDPSYMQLKDRAPKDINPAVLLAEYASLKWLSMNRPDYKQVVAETLDEIKREIMANRDMILAS
jgi:isocitrate lyase